MGSVHSVFQTQPRVRMQGLRSVQACCPEAVPNLHFMSDGEGELARSAVVWPGLAMQVSSSPQAVSQLSCSCLSPSVIHLR